MLSYTINYPHCIELEGSLPCSRGTTTGPCPGSDDSTRHSSNLLLGSILILSTDVCIVVLTLDAGLLARSQYPEGPATGHLDTGFSWIPCVYKRMLDGSQVSELLLHASRVALPT